MCIMEGLDKWARVSLLVVWEDCGNIIPAPGMGCSGWETRVCVDFVAYDPEAHQDYVVFEDGAGCLGQSCLARGLWGMCVPLLSI
jgi:hypothetical protein